MDFWGAIFGLIGFLSWCLLGLGLLTLGFALLSGGQYWIGPLVFAFAVWAGLRGRKQAEAKRREVRPGEPEA